VEIAAALGQRQQVKTGRGRSRASGDGDDCAATAPPRTGRAVDVFIQSND
jgi:hypothetical protein